MSVVCKVEELEHALGRVLAELAEVRAVLGKPPDPFANSEEARAGSGIAAATCHIAHAVYGTDTVTDVRVGDGLLTRMARTEQAVERLRLSRPRSFRTAGVVVGLIVTLATLAANVYLVARGQHPLPPPPSVVGQHGEIQHARGAAP